MPAQYQSLTDPLVSTTTGTPAEALKTSNEAFDENCGVYSWDISTIGIPKETRENETRVAVTPVSLNMLVKAGFRVLIETGAGDKANMEDMQYLALNSSQVQIVSTDEAWSADVILKVNPCTEQEMDRLRPGQTLYSMAENLTADGKAMMKRMETLGVNYFAMEKVPRLSRSQVFDALSSQANIAGTKAVLMAANEFSRMFGMQMTAAGKTEAAKVLVIGCGVAGLAAAITAKNMGAVVKAFDTRPVVKEQVESVGCSFITMSPEFMAKMGEGQGGYAKDMDDEFLAEEHRLFASHLPDIDIVISTAQIPGRPAPKLITSEMVSTMKRGSVIVDLAAAGGGNAETTRVGERYVSANGVIHIGYTDIPARMPTQSSRLYSNNITKLLLSMCKDGAFNLDLTDDVTRASMVTYKGMTLPAPSRHIGPPPGTAAKTESKTKAIVKPVEASPFMRTLQTSFSIMLGLLVLMFAEYMDNDPKSLNMLIIFTLSGAAGYQAVWGVVPALHTPLMAVTNAISGITAYGAILMFAHTKGQFLPRILSIIGAMVSFVNIFGGFFVTYRMLAMFQRPNDPYEHNYLYLIPGMLVPIIFLGDQFEFGVVTSQCAYLGASLCCIGAISGLSAMTTSRIGAALGMIGVFLGLTVTIGIAGMGSYDMMLVGGQMAAGALVGYLIGNSVQITELPQTVAAFHSLVGLAAQVTSIAHYGSFNTVEEVTNCTASTLGNFIGGITLTGSIVAFCKLHGISSSKALHLPFKNLINIASVVAVIFLGYMAQEANTISTGLFYQFCVAAVSLWFGFHLVASVGGGDMPVCITVLNSYSGWALVAEGFMMNNSMMTTVGSLIGFSGAILSYIMCVAMNRSLANVLFGGYATVAPSKTKEKETRVHTETNVEMVSELVQDARYVIVVPGYGMAVSKAQHALHAFSSMCVAAGKKVKYAIHPVAGRMPGQMNVLLAEAGVPYDIVEEMEDINDELSEADVVLVIGANDTTNQAASTDPDCPIAGMPVIKVWEGKNVVFMKRSMAVGYAAIDNPVFYNENTQMFLGDAKKKMEELNTSLRAIYEA